MNLPTARHKAESDLITAKAQALHHARAAREAIILGHFVCVKIHTKASDEYHDQVVSTLLDMDKLGILDIGKSILGDYRKVLDGIIADCERLKNQGEEAANV